MDNFFYNLNDKLNAIRDLPSTTPGQLNERDMSRAAKGYEKYGKEGMEALAKAGREGKALDPVRNKYDKYDEGVEEGLGSMARKVGGMAKKVAGKALDTLGHGSDQDLRKKMQRDMGATGAQVHGKKSMAIPNNEAAAPMSAKQKSFAKLAPPEDKITFADRIAGAKKEVDEMLGDVAANAMKQAMGGGRGRSAEVDEEVKSRKIAGSRYGGAKQVDKPEHDDAPKAKAKAGRPESDQLKPDWSAFGGNKPVKLGKHKGAVTKHEIGDKPTSDVGKEADAAFKASEKSAKKVKEGPDVSVTDRGEYDQEGDMAKDDIKTIVRHAQALEKILGDDDNLPEWVQSKLTKIESMMTAVDDYMQSKSEGDQEQMVGEKAVSVKQRRAAGIAHAAQKGEIPKSKLKGASKEMSKMPKGELNKFASTKEKGLPEKKKPEGKKKEVDETTSSGSVATSSAPAKGKGGMSFGQGIYDSFNRDVEAMIAEGMTINMSMNTDAQGGPAKSLTVTATDEDAEQLAQMLSNAGMGSAHAGEPEMHSGDESCGSCGMPECGCGDIEEALDENNPDWPTEPTGQEDNINYYDTDGLNGRKSTGQTTVPVVASQGDRQGMAEGAGYDGSEPLDLSKNPSVNDVFKRALYIYDYEGYGNDMDYSEDEAIEQYVAQKFGQDVLDQLNTAKNQQYFGRDDGKGPGGGGRTSNLGTSSAPGGDFRTTKAGVMNKQDAKTMKGRIADRLGRHPEPNLPEQSYAEAEQDALHRMMEMAGVKKKEVDEEKTDEGNLFTKGLEDDNIKVGEKIPGTNAIKKKDIDTTNKDLEESLMRQLSNFKK